MRLTDTESSLSIQTRDLIKKELRPVVSDAIKRVSTIQTRGINKKGLRPVVPDAIKRVSTIKTRDFIKTGLRPVFAVYFPRC